MAPKNSAPKTRRSRREEAKSVVDEADADLSTILIDASGESALGALEADEWVRQSGWTPVEFLTAVYRNPLQKPQDRIAAAKAVLDYTHRKLPARVELTGELGTRGITLDGIALSKLSDKELDALTKLLEKVK